MFAQPASEYPDLPEPHNNLAVLYALRGEYVKARDSLLLAINTHPSYATAHENLGDIYAKMAGLAYDKALQLDRENESAKAKLALMTDLISIDQPMESGSTQVSIAQTTEVELEPVVAGAEETTSSAIQVVRDWVAYKSRVNATKSYVNIELTELSVLGYPGEEDLVVVTFFQDYQSSNFEVRIPSANTGNATPMIRGALSTRGRLKYYLSMCGESPTRRARI